MDLTRRKFLSLIGGAATGAVVFQACGVPEEELLVESPIEMPEDMVDGMHNWYATVCRQCPTAEGIVVRVMEGRAKKIEGNLDYPINRGKHSVRCEASLQGLYHPDRLKGPLVRLGDRGSGQFEEISWSDAISRLTFQLEKLQQANKQSELVMVTDPTTGHVRMVVDEFVSKFGGKQLVYEPLESNVLASAIENVFGQKRVPDFDIENSSYILSFGADFLSTWVSPVRFARGYGEFRQGTRPRGRLIHVDSRFSTTAANADEWFHVNPGTEGLLALSIAQVIVSKGLGDINGVEALTGGDSKRLDAFAPSMIAGKISDAFSNDEIVSKIHAIAEEFISSDSSLAIGGGSASAHTNGLFNLTAIYSLNHLVGNIGQPGGIIFNPDPPLKSLSTASTTSPFKDWQNLTEQMKNNDVQVLMINGANPWYGLPNSVDFKSASFKVPFIFSFSNMIDDTTAMADLILPTHHSLEDWGTDIPNPGPGYQTIGFQQPVVRPLFENRGIHLGTRGFPDILLEAADKIGLNLELPGSNFKNLLEAGALELFQSNRGSVKAKDFQRFWNGILQRGGWWDTSAKYDYSNMKTDPPVLPNTLEDPKFNGPEGSDTFHLMPFTSASLGNGEGASLPWLQATPDPITTATWQTWVEINYHVAKDLDIDEGDVVVLKSNYGSIEALAYPHPGMPPNIVSVPVGQGHTSGGRYAEGRGSNILSILAPQTDGQVGSLAWASTRVSIKKTDRWIRLPKFENTVPEPPRDKNQEIIKITNHDT